MDNVANHGCFAADTMPMPIYPFLKSKNDQELVTEAAKELVRILKIEFYACGGKNFPTQLRPVGDFPYYGDWNSLS